MKSKQTWIILAVIGMLLLGVALASAEPLAGYTLDWWTVDGGGGTSSGGSYSLSGTIGQPDAGSATGGGYALSGGFWGGAPASLKIFLPSVTR